MRAIAFKFCLLALVGFTPGLLACDNPLGCTTEVTRAPTAQRSMPVAFERGLARMMESVNVVRAQELATLSGNLSANRAVASTGPGSSLPVGQASPVTGLNISENLIATLDLKAAGWTDKGGALVTDNPETLGKLIEFASRLVVTLEPMLAKAINTNGGNATGNNSSLNWKELGVALASNRAVDVKAVVKNASDKMVWFDLDRKASDFTVAVWLASYAILAPEGARFLPWAVARAIHKSNLFFGAVVDELEKNLAKKSSSETEKKLGLLRATLNNKDLWAIRDWLAELGPMVVIEKEISEDETEKGILPIKLEPNPTTGG